MSALDGRGVRRVMCDKCGKTFPIPPSKDIAWANEQVERIGWTVTTTMSEDENTFSGEPREVFEYTHACNGPKDTP